MMKIETTIILMIDLNRLLQYINNSRQLKITNINITNPLQVLILYKVQLMFQDKLDKIMWNYINNLTN